MVQGAMGDLGSVGLGRRYGTAPGRDELSDLGIQSKSEAPSHPSYFITALAHCFLVAAIESTYAVLRDNQFRYGLISGCKKIKIYGVDREPQGEAGLVSGTLSDESTCSAFLGTSGKAKTPGDEKERVAYALEVLLITP